MLLNKRAKKNPRMLPEHSLKLIFQTGFSKCHILGYFKNAFGVSLCCNCLNIYLPTLHINGIYPFVFSFIN